MNVRPNGRKRCTRPRWTVRERTWGRRRSPEDRRLQGTQRARRISTTTNNAGRTACARPQAERPLGDLDGTPRTRNAPQEHPTSQSPIRRSPPGRNEASLCQTPRRYISRAGGTGSWDEGVATAAAVAPSPGMRRPGMRPPGMRRSSLLAGSHRAVNVRRNCSTDCTPPGTETGRTGATEPGPVRRQFARRGTPARNIPTVILSRRPCGRQCFQETNKLHRERRCAVTL
jgi:hypothetical protein